MTRNTLVFLFGFASIFAGAAASENGVDEYSRIINDQSFAHLRPVSIDTFKSLKNIDPAIFDEKITPEDVLECTIADFRQLLDKSIRYRGGIMHYFPHPYYRYSQKIHYWSRDALNVGNSEFYVGTMFPPRGRTRSIYKDHHQTIPEDTYFMYEGVLVGRGRLVVIYPHHISVNRTDPPFSIMTGNYDLNRVNILDNESEYGGPIRFTNIRGRDYPEDNFESVRGPMNFPLTAARLDHWKDEKLYFALNFIWIPIPHPLFRRYTPPLYELPSESTRIPQETIEYTKRLATQK